MSNVNVFNKAFRNLNLMKKYSVTLLSFQNSLDYETFIKLVEIHKMEPTWKMYFEKIKKKMYNSSWVKKINVMNKNETL